MQTVLQMGSKLPQNKLMHKEEGDQTFLFLFGWIAELVPSDHNYIKKFSDRLH